MKNIPRVSIVAIGAAVAGLVLLLGLAAYFLRGDSPREAEQAACTMDALVCPDGSSVGRTGPECRFTACPDVPALTGTLRQSADGFTLELDADPSGAGTVYAVPLKLRVSNALQDLVNTRVTAVGGFNEGNTLSVEQLTPAGGTGGGAPVEARGEAALAIGETKEVGGVRITLHEVVGDYRCPVDVQCIEAGAITARVTMETGDTREDFNMPSDEAPRPFGPVQISIVDIAPPRVSTEEPDPQAYIVTFKVEPIGTART